MSGVLLTLPLDQQRDLVRARKAARQAADFLGFSSADQIGIATAVFELAWQAFAAAGRGEVRFEIVDECLQVVCAPGANGLNPVSVNGPSALTVRKRLPASAAVSRADVPWMLQQLAERGPLNVFEEMHKLNQELLQTLLDVARQRDTSGAPGQPHAA